MTLFAKLYTDIHGDPKLMRAARKGEKQLDKLPWLLAFAKKQDDDGRLSVNGEAADPIDIAAGVPCVTATQIGQCMRSLEHIGVLARDPDGVLRFVAWEWRSGTKPSETPERVSERVSRHRARKRAALAAVTPCNDQGVTTCNGLEKEQEEEKESDEEKEPEKELRESAGTVAIEATAKSAFGDHFAEIERFLETRRPHTRKNWLREMLKVAGPGASCLPEDVAGACADALATDEPIGGPHALRAFAEKRRQERTRSSEPPSARRAMQPGGVISASDAYVDKILGLVNTASTPGQAPVTFVRRADVLELGEQVAAAYDAVGGSAAFIAAKAHPSDKLHFLRRDFAAAFARAIHAKPASVA